MVHLSTNTASKLLSKLAQGNGHGEDSPYFDGWKAYDSDPFHPTMNPRGVIQMGLAENQLSFEFVEKWIKNNPKASICSVEGVHEFKDIANFQDYHGLPRFRNAVANFMAKVRGNRVQFDPDRVVMSGGATGAHETVAFCLANPGEAFLVPIPYYPGFDRDLTWRTGVKIVPVICESSTNFKLTREAMETAYVEAEKSGLKVKGLLITNPSNPLGTVYDKKTLETAVTFINEKNIHLVCDEIYAATVFAEPGFISISEVIENDTECDKNLIHVVYSLSKDMGFPGFRVGIIYSYNDAVVACARKMSSFGLVSSQTQYLIASMLSDDAFVDRFLVGSAEKLATRHRNFTKELAQVGIGYLKGSGGLFLWMDLRHLLKEKTLEAEMTLWRVIINDVKLNVSPGSSFHCSEPGWFRVCFANMDDNTMDISITRIRNFVLQNKEVAKVKKQKFCWRQSSLELRLSSRRLEDIMSPHSPLPQSPMLRATT
ncbi:1-aminocyclopropane-1-carboxylate synthase-like [Cucurbita moschata]|uniref:1-aminocyclopropane-1-carboxylate synthase n=1 Tax=Cucurbita moschata TaxID=3662 RepID=A0A6J1EU27_CUCMO|nr:1-aminocyclopropane-1-carboxylate synthase-like [Cucurbita moschata]